MRLILILMMINLTALRSQTTSIKSDSSNVIYSFSIVVEEGELVAYEKYESEKNGDRKLPLNDVIFYFKQFYSNKRERETKKLKK